jgi:DNA-binding CsgD family transcriptional regulator
MGRGRRGSPTPRPKETFAVPAFHSEAPRRVGVVALHDDTGGGPQAPQQPPVEDSLRTVAAEIVRAVEGGEVRDEPPDGVLLDLTVGRIRCLLVEQQSSVAVALSPREQQIALMVAAGRTNQAIAGSLEISAWTVSTHLRRIYAKLAVSSRAEMVAHLLGHPDYAYLVDPSREHVGR